MPGVILGIGAWGGGEAAARGVPLARLFSAEVVAVLALAAGATLLLTARARLRIRRARLALARPPSPAEGVLSTVLALRPGMPACIDIYAGGAPRRAAATITAVEDHWVVLSSAPGAIRCSIGTPAVVTATSEMAAYRFPATVRDHRNGADATVIYVDRPLWVDRVQRRGFARIPVDLPTTVTPLGGAPDASVAYRAVLMDISAGGFRVLSGGALAPGMRVRVRLPIEAVNAACFEARVLRVSAARSPFACSAQCEFIGLSEGTRRLIAAHCLEVQRALFRRPQGPAATRPTG